MDAILQSVLDVQGVGAAMVIDGTGQVLGHRGQAVYDRGLCGSIAASVLKAVDTVQLQQEDWEALTANFADGKLLMRNLAAPGGLTYVLAVVADASLNPSFAIVAIRVAANKLKKALGSPASSMMGSAVAAAASTVRAGSSSGVHAPPPAVPVPPIASQSGVGLGADSRPGLATGQSWARGGSTVAPGAGSSVGLSRIAVADAPSQMFLQRAAKELAKHVGPMAKVFVEEAVRRVTPDAPFSMAAAPRLVLDLADQIDDVADRGEFSQVMSKP